MSTVNDTSSGAWNGRGYSQQGGGLLSTAAWQNAIVASASVSCKATDAKGVIQILSAGAGSPPPTGGRRS